MQCHAVSSNMASKSPRWEHHLQVAHVPDESPRNSKVFQASAAFFFNHEVLTFKARIPTRFLSWCRLVSANGLEILALFHWICMWLYIYHYNMHIDHCIFPILMAFWWALCPPIWWDSLPKRRRTRHSTMRGEILLHPVSGWKVLLGTCCSLNPYLGWWFQMVLIYKDHLFLNIEPVD